MLLIILEHLAMFSESAESAALFDRTVYLAARSLGCIAVNGFVLLSGYFGIHLRIEKLIFLDLRTVFYSYAALAVSVVLGIYTFSPISGVKELFPVLCKTYWFITVYFVLCIISPFLNRFLASVGEKDLRRMLVVCGIVFYALATFCYAINADQIVPDAGYGIVNFVYLYCLGYYIRNHYDDRHGWKFYAAGCFVSQLAVFVSNSVMSKILGFRFSSFNSYNTVFVLTGAVCLFLVFKNITVKQSSVINRISRKTLAVYMIHFLPHLREYIFKDLLDINRLSGTGLLLAFVLLPVPIYLVCFAIDTAADLILMPIDRLVKKIVSKYPILTKSF